MKKISVIIHSNKKNECLKKCIESINGQTYKNIEIIVLKNNLEDEEFLKEQKNIKLIETEKESNLFDSYIIGSKQATGDYLSFVYEDDYLENDFYRLLVEKIEKDKSDVVIGNLVRFNNNKKYVHGLTFNTNNEVYDGENFFEMYFKQTGRNIRYNLLCNKLIKSDIWEKVIKVTEDIENKIKLNEEFIFTTLALYYSESISFSDNAIYYHAENNNKINKVNIIDDNISNINKVFNVITEFLKKENIINKYKNDIEIWEAFYISKQIDIYINLKSQDENIKELNYNYKKDKKLNEFYRAQELDKSWYNYYKLETEYTEDFNDIKKLIMNPEIKIVSFDMFDTLVSRPFFLPHEMFDLLNKTFLKIFKPINAVEFSIIRRKSENELRDIKNKKKIQEVTLDEIYDYISKTYNLDSKKLDKLKEKEIDMEIHFCKRRNSGYELYSLAKYLGKKVILTSDIYLKRDTIEKILKKAGYKFDEIYLSSEILKTKSSGSLYEYIIKKEKTNKFVHIGDNYQSDYEKAKEYDIISAHLPKATFTMMGYTGKNVRYCGQLYRQFVSFNHDHISYEENYGVRCSLGVVANYYFDNPFIPFNTLSDFNGDPYFIGYYALGMQLISMCKWLLEDAKENNIDSIAFMARDGYLPYEASKIYASKTSEYKDIKLNYTYVSRKALMPLLLREKNGISLIETYLDYDMLSPKDLIEQLGMVITSSEKIEKEINKEFKLDKKFENKNDFNRCLSIIYDKCFDKKKYNTYFNMCKKYFNNELSGNTSTFDIGYSGKPEAIISSVIEKTIRTYFIHANNSSAYNNTKASDSKLVTFYDYKPTITGTIRELFVSSIGPSCIGYKYEEGEVKPIFKNYEKYSYYNIDMINKIQQGALDFVRDFCDNFKDYIKDMDLNRYYMSIPLEYYFHYTNIEDRLPTKNLIFENNVNNYIELNDYIFKKYSDYKKEYSLGKIPEKEKKIDIDYTLPKSRVRRIFYYTLHDRKSLKKKWEKWSSKKEDPNTLPKSRAKRIMYYLIFDKKQLIRKRKK